MKKKYYWIAGIFLIAAFILLVLSYFPLEKQTQCKWDTDCPTDFKCYSSFSGGLGPEGALPENPMGGDFLCHKDCSNVSCPLFQVCKEKEIIREDMSLTLNFCLPLSEA